MKKSILILIVQVLLILATVSCSELEKEFRGHGDDACGGCPRGMYCAVVNGRGTCLFEPSPTHAPQDCESVTDLNRCPSPQCKLVSASGCCGQRRKLCVTNTIINPLIFPPPSQTCNYNSTVCLKEVLTNQIYEIPSNCQPKKGWESFTPNTQTCASLNCTGRGLVCGYGQNTECIGTKCCTYVPFCVHASKLYPGHGGGGVHPPPPPPPHGPCPVSPKDMAGLQIVCRALDCSSEGKSCIGFFDNKCPQGSCCGPYARCDVKPTRPWSGPQLKFVVSEEFDYPEKKVEEKKVEEKKVEEKEHKQKKKVETSHAIDTQETQQTQDLFVGGSCESLQNPWSCGSYPQCRWATIEGCCGHSQSMCLSVNASRCHPQFPFGSNRPLCYTDIIGRQNVMLDDPCVTLPARFKQYDPFIGTCESLRCNLVGLTCAMAKLSPCQGNACCHDAALCVPRSALPPRPLW